jgi:hypothetical protein
MKKPYYELEIHVNELADFLFIKNVNNTIIELQLGGISNNKDLFFFCLDLFCKGLVKLFGIEGKSVNLEDLTEDNFISVREKMLCAGINANLSIFPSEISIDLRDEDGKQKSILNLEELNTEDNNKALKEYEFKVMNNNKLYIVKFNLVHRV